jgi:hypothetical protein
MKNKVLYTEEMYAKFLKSPTLMPCQPIMTYDVIKSIDVEQSCRSRVYLDLNEIKDASYLSIQTSCHECNEYGGKATVFFEKPLKSEQQFEQEMIEYNRQVDLYKQMVERRDKDLKKLKRQTSKEREYESYLKLKAKYERK